MQLLAHERPQSSATRSRNLGIAGGGEPLKNRNGKGLERLAHQLVLAGEVVVQGRLGDVRLLGDGLQAHPVIAARSEHLDCDAHDVGLAPVATAREPAARTLARIGCHGLHTGEDIRASTLGLVLRIADRLLD